MSTPVDPAEANRLYWETDESVADIARRLDMSRRALYVAVQPLPTGESCEVCGGPMTFENRSARTAGHATCEACVTAEELDGTEADLPVQATPELMVDEHMVRIGGAALFGAAIGALLTLAVVPRR
jgi:hypothetical protein